MKKQKTKNKKQKIILSFLVVISTILILIPGFVQADLVPCGGPNEPPCQICHLFVMLDRLVRFVFVYLIFPIATLLIVISGGMLIFSAGDSGRLSQGKSIFFSTLIGLLIIFSAWLLVNLFMTGIGMADWVGRGEGWYRIRCPVIQI
jgi:hypothetical protein